MWWRVDVFSLLVRCRWVSMKLHRVHIEMSKAFRLDLLSGSLREADHGITALPGSGTGARRAHARLALSSTHTIVNARTQLLTVTMRVRPSSFCSSCDMMISLLISMICRSRSSNGGPLSVRRLAGH